MYNKFKLQRMYNPVPNFESGLGEQYHYVTLLCRSSVLICGPTELSVPQAGQKAMPTAWISVLSSP
jgi:hypothetical protein